MCVKLIMDPYVFSLSLMVLFILFIMSVPSVGFLRLHFFILVALSALINDLLSVMILIFLFLGALVIASSIAVHSAMYDVLSLPLIVNVLFLVDFLL